MANDSFDLFGSIFVSLGINGLNEKAENLNYYPILRRKVVENLWKKLVILIALQFRYTLYIPQTKRLRAREIGLQYKIR